MEKETIIVKGMTLSANGKRLITVSPFFDGIIPEGVEEICDGVFEHSHFESITLPSTIKIIGKGAFASANISEINLPEGLLSIGKGAFSFTEIKEISLPGSLRTIPQEAFSYSSINKVCIRDGVEIIEKEAFSYCDELQIVEMPESLKEIHEGAFFVDNALTEASLPANLELVGDNAFCWCPELHFRDRLPRSLKHIGDGAFYCCKFDVPFILHDGIEHIGGGAFVYADIQFDVQTGKYEADDNILYTSGKYKTISMYGCADVVAVDDRTKVIGEKAFCQAENLKEVTLSEGLTHIEREAFKWDKELKEILFPKSLKSIGDMAFFDTGLLNVTVPEKVENFTLAFANTRIAEATILCKKVSDNAFFACGELLSMTFGKETTDIGPSSFEQCSALRELILPEGIKVIQDRAFQGCNNLKKVVLPSTLTSMGAQSFSYCESLEEVFVNGCPKDWNGFAFIGSEYLKEVHINEDMRDRLINVCKTKDPKFIDKLTIYNL